MCVILYGTWGSHPELVSGSPENVISIKSKRGDGELAISPPGSGGVPQSAEIQSDVEMLS